MFNSSKFKKKIITVWSLFSMLLNMAQPAIFALTFATPAYAQVATDSSSTPAPSPELSPEPSASPIESIAPSIEPSPEPSLSPSPEATITPTPSVEPSVEPTPTPTPAPSNPPSNPEPSQDSSPAPPSSNVSAESAAPSSEPTPSPITTPLPNPDEHLNIAIVDNTAAQSIQEFDLTVTETGSATLATDKADYAPTDTAIITGSGFLANTTYSITISSTDDPATSTTVDVTTDVDGTLFYAYQLDGIYRPNYKVEAYLGSSLVATVTFTDSYVPTYTYTIDTAGANDEPGQKDLTRMGIDSTQLPTTLYTVWQWDETGWTGANTGDSCNLFDTDGDGNANYAICVTVSDTYAAQTSDSPRIYSCNNAYNDKCGGHSLVAGPYLSSCSVDRQANQPFASGDDTPYDTNAYCTVQVSEVGGSSAELIDSCSFPSQQPNSDPSDCVGARARAGKLEVVKVLSPSNDSGLFNLNIDNVAQISDIGNGGTTGEKVVNEGDHTVGESAGTGTNLANYSSSIDCRDLNGTGTTVASSSNSGPLTVNVVDGSDIVCTITNTRIQGTLTVTKNVINDNGGDLTIGSFPLFVNGNSVTSGVANSFTPGTYTISETNQPGYSQTGIVCDNGKVNPVVLNAGDIVTCTITNDDIAPSLTLVKQVTNDDGGTAVAGDWTLTATGYDPNAPQIGTYNLSESGGPTGYALTSLTCDNSTGQVSSVTLGLGEDVTCTFVNDDIAPTLTLVKTVVNDNGGTLQVADFPLFIASTAVISGVANTVLANTPYIVSETNQTGYLGSVWGGDCAEDGSITLQPGDNLTCTITNNDVAPILTLIKTVSNNYGGTLDVSDFSLFIDNLQVTSGIGEVLSAGTYTASETNVDGYTGSDWGGDCNADGSITLAVGDNKTCTITNDDQPGTLIVNKVIVGSDADASEFSFEVNDGSAIDFESDGQNSLTVDAGTYSVIETTVDGYDTTYDNCDDLVIANGSSVTCTITNTKLGSISGHKAEDQDGLLSTTDDQEDVNGWGMSLYKWDGDSFEDTGISTQTDQNGDYLFDDLLPGTYEVREEAKTDWTPLAPESGTIEVVVAAGDNKTGNDFINSDDRKITFCHATASEGNPFVTITTSTSAAYHAHLGDQQSHQWGEDIIPPFIFDGETYSQNWDAFGQATYRNGCNNDVYGSITINKTITPDNFEQSFTFDLAGEATDSAQVMGGSSHVFTDLLPGSYNLTEILPSGWSFDYAFCGDEESYVPGDSITLSAAQDLSCTFHNVATEPELRIQKSNDAVGSKNPGDIVTFTITVDLTGSALGNVVVTDVTPDGFDYVAGSWSATKNGNPFVIAEPNYGSPGSWNLGSLNPDDEVVLTYQTKISADQDGGTYNDLAWASGDSQPWGNILALGHDSEYVNDVFVGTDVEVNKSKQQTGSVSIEKESGDVLGASTELPSTGAATGWMLLALGSLLVGLFLIFGGKHLRKSAIFLIPVFSLLYSASPVMAVTPSNLAVRVEVPTSPTRVNEWKLSYSVLDRLNRTPSVSCYVKKPGSGSFVQFDSTKVSVKPSGDNDHCQVNSSIMSEQGDYQFKVTATAGGDSKDSATVIVTYDTNGPGTPGNYSKEHPSICRWVIKFHTASDNGATTKVEVYSSDQKSFDTNNSTRVGSVSLGSDQDGSFIHDRADGCDKEWYYVVRAFDSVGNQSGHVGDQVVKITSSTTASSPTTGAIALANPAAGNVLGVKSEDNQDSDITSPTPSASPESIEGQGLVAGAKDATQTASARSRKWWILVGIIAILGGYAYLRKNKAK